MKKRIFTTIIILVLAITATIGVYATTNINLTISGTYNYDLANEALTLTNKERAQVGVAALQMDNELNKIAQERAKEAALYFSHNRPTGEELKITNVHGENLAAGASTAQGVINDWMDSSGHKQNILYPSYKSIGIASFTTTNGATYWVQVFSMKSASSANTFKGSKEVKSQEVKIKSSFITNIKVYDLQYKKLKVGEEYTIKNAAVKNGGWSAYTAIDNKNFTFTSSDPKIATIDNNGKIKGLSNGKVTITAKLLNLKASYEITVGTLPVEVEKISFVNNSYKMYEKNTLKFDVNITPSNATDKSLTWKSSDESIATVDNEGNVTTLKPGDVTITVTTSNGKKASFELNVSQKEITTLFITDYPNTLYIGETGKIETSIYPKTATEDVKYKTSDSKVLTIDSKGNIKALKEGKVKVTVSSKKTSDEVEIIVMKKKEPQQETKPEIKEETKPIEQHEEPKQEQKEEIKDTNKYITSVSLDKKEITLKVGEKYTPTLTVNPTDTTEIVKPTWIGFDYRIAEISSNGTITAKSVGEGTVKVLVGKNNVEASIKVKVIPSCEITSMSFDYYTSNLRPGGVGKIHLSINPEGANDYYNIKWTSTDNNILEVRQGGTVFAHTPGKVIITATAPNGVSVSKEFVVNN